MKTTEIAIEVLEYLSKINLMKGVSVKTEHDTDLGLDIHVYINHNKLSATFNFTDDESDSELLNKARVLKLYIKGYSVGK